MKEHKEDQKKDTRADPRKTDQQRGNEEPRRDQQGQGRPQQDKQR